MSAKGTIGIAGLGLMGRAFAGRLVDAGYRVLAYDVRSVEAPAGVELQASLAGLAAHCEAILLSVFDTAQVEYVLFGPEGLLAAQVRAPILCTSTCDPDEIAAIAQRCAAHGVEFLELPFSGTSQQVARGDGVGLVGGDEQLAQRLAPVLDVLCPRRQYVGRCGDAGRAKLAVNLVLGLHRAALAEGLNFGRRIGLDPARLLQILQGSAAASSVMPVKGPLMVQRRYDAPQSRVDQSLKDFGLIRALGRRAGQPLPLAEVYVQLLESCLARGEGGQDNAIIHEAIARIGSDVPGDRA
jgi:3-hydroxyisobutyrate dehydrogenase-like beta-hydroxyacid dehydrogenase